jgi:general secretion pathway protein H
VITLPGEYRSQRGFSLLEILVVLVLIAVTTSLVVVNFRHDAAQQVEREAMRFAALIEQLCQESVIRGRVLAITQDDASGYRFVELADKGWQPVSGVDLLRPRRLPDDMRVALTAPEVSADEEKVYLVCRPDGMLPRFSARFSQDQIRYRVQTTELQQVEIVDDGNG